MAVAQDHGAGAGLEKAGSELGLAKAKIPEVIKHAVPVPAACGCCFDLVEYDYDLEAGEEVWFSYTGPSTYMLWLGEGHGWLSPEEFDELFEIINE